MRDSARPPSSTIDRGAIRCNIHESRDHDAGDGSDGLRDNSGLVGKSLFTHDIDKWFDQHFIPALKKAGVNLEDPAEVAAFNSKFFSNRTAADVAATLVSGQAQRVRRREQQEKATGLAGAESLHTKDVGVAMEAANTQLTNMASSAKFAEASIAGLNSAMGLIQHAGREAERARRLVRQGQEAA